MYLANSFSLSSILTFTGYILASTRQARDNKESSNGFQVLNGLVPGYLILDL